MPILKYKDPDTKEWKAFDVVSDGITFLPSIDPNTNILSWDNNGHLPNPEPITLVSKGIDMRESKAKFPIPGDENVIYIDKQTSSMYRWDSAVANYVPLSATGTAQSIVFVQTVPAAADAEDGLIYAVKQDDGKFELWAKEGDKMSKISDPEGGSGIDTKIVDTLPTTEISDSTIYMVKDETSSDASNGYNEYMHINGDWERLDATSEMTIVNEITEENINGLF